jgi:tetratricopeptide (TPR) repeat protein
MYLDMGTAFEIENTNSIAACWLVKRVFFMAAVVALSILTAASQENHAASAPRTQAQPGVSTNELLAPHKAQTAVNHAREALDRRRYDEASRNIAHALEIYPNYALALQVRGLLKLRENRLAEACADFQQAIQLDPNLGAAYIALGAAYNRLGHFQEAVFPLTRAATILPRAWTVHYESALAYLGMGEYEAALNEISQAVNNIPAEPDNRSSVFYTKGRVLLKMKDYSGAKEAFEQSIKQDPQGHLAALSQKSLEQLQSQTGSQELIVRERDPIL